MTEKCHRIDRRRLVLAASATACLPLGKALAGAPSGSERLAALLEDFANADLDASPEQTTALGLDVGHRSLEKRFLDSRSSVALADRRQRISMQLAQLQSVRPATLYGTHRVDYEVVQFTLDATNRANSRYDFGPGAGILPYVGAGAPYVLSQLTGAYSYVPDLLETQHQIESRADADAYLDRLRAFAATLDQEIELVRQDAARGCTPPDFVLAKTHQQLKALRDTPAAQSNLVTSLARRVQSKGFASDYSDQAQRLVGERVQPALDRQLAFVAELQSKATSDAGVWKFRNGDDYYADCLVAWASTELNPGEIHRLALEYVAQMTARIDAVMREHGITHGSVATRLQEMFADSRFHYVNDEGGRRQLLADLELKLHAARARLPDYFGVLPKAEVVIRPVPTYMETARPSGYYEPPTLDDGRPGIFYINLRNTAETPTWLLPTHLYHETIPGHHLKGSLYQEAKLPTLRKTALYSAYMEGWSLYAEQLADEMGLYDNDTLGRIGYLHSALRAGVAAVADTGLHAMKWSREKAIDYFTGVLGDLQTTAATEIERYCVWPGQVCAYMLDSQAILRAREDAKAALGSRFDIRQFHDALLLSGPLPQPVLMNVVQRYIHANRRRHV